METMHEDTESQCFDPVEVRFAEYQSAEVLGRLWQDLEPRCSNSFFLSWTWIGTWLETSGVHPVVLEFFARGRIVGLGLLVSAQRALLGFPRSTLFLHETGIPSRDSVMIEANGFLAERNYEQAVARAALDLLEAESKSDIALSGVPGWVKTQVLAARWPHRIAAIRNSPYRILGLQPDNELRGLSRNTRSQIVGSMRRYERMGPLSIMQSTGLADARSRLVELARLHQARWTAVGQGGAFASRYFREFHDRLLTKGFANGQVDVLEIAADRHILGYLYNFQYRNSVYSYQNGFSFSSDPRLKPGLVSHVLAFDHYRNRGARYYHFLAGESRYKASLSNSSFELFWIILERNGWRRRIDHLARNIKTELEQKVPQWLCQTNRARLRAPSSDKTNS